MKNRINIIFFSALFLIAFLLSISFLGMLLGFNFTDDNYHFTYVKILSVIIPIAMLFLLVKIIKKDDSRARKQIKVFYGVLISASSAIVIFTMLIFGGMCGYGEIEVLYQKKSNPNTKIVYQYMNCGAYDSDVPDPQTYKVRNVTKYMTRSSKIDTAKIDMNLWEEIK